MSAHILDPVARREALGRITPTDPQPVVILGKSLAGRVAHFHGSFHVLDKRDLWPVSPASVDVLRAVTRPVVRSTYGNDRGVVARLCAALENNLPSAIRLREVLALDDLVDDVKQYIVIVTGTRARPVLNYQRVDAAGAFMKTLYAAGGHVEQLDSNGDLVPLTRNEVLSDE